jgi:hypothetical protein
MANALIQLYQNILIPPAAFQGAALTAGSAYWIVPPASAAAGQGVVNASPSASLVLAGTSIAAATVFPPYVLDLSLYRDPQWALFYGAQTAGVGMKVGLAELWTPMAPESSSILPYVRDATSHYLSALGLTQNIIRTIPGTIDAIFDFTTAANTGVTAGPFDMEDFEEIFVNLQFSGAQTGCTVQANECDAHGTALQISTAQAVTGSATYAAMNWGPGSSYGIGGLTAIQGMLPWRTQLVIGAAGSGVTTRVRITGKRRLPIRRILSVAPYIQAITWPSTGSAIYFDMRSNAF